MQPPVFRLSSRQLLAVVVGQLLALTVQAWLSRTLIARGVGALQAHYLAYIAVPPILLVVLAPLLFEHRLFLQRLFSRHALTIRVVLAAGLLGVAMRVAWWSQLVARVSLGVGIASRTEVSGAPVLAWACPPLPQLLVGVLVMVALVPVVEETVHRGLLQSAFVHRGPLPAVLVSTVFFTVFHPPSSHGFVLVTGIVLGAQFWLTGSLWPSMITHATYNGLAQLDWRCLHGRWGPGPEDLPQLVTGAIALIILAVAALTVLLLLRLQRAGARVAPAPVASRTHSRRVR